MSEIISDLGIVVAAGGSGQRYGQGNKLFQQLNGLPLFFHCLRNFSGLCNPEAMVMVVPEKEIEAFRAKIEAIIPKQKLILIAGGTDRTRSVLNGLSALPEYVRYVAIHDAARPLATTEMLCGCLDLARQHDGAIVARPQADTLKRADENGLICATVSRENLWAVETPQIMNLEKLKTAYAKVAEISGNYTDDAGIMEAAGCKIALYHAKSPNLKLTYPGDLEIMEKLI